MTSGDIEKALNAILASAWWTGSPDSPTPRDKAKQKLRELVAQAYEEAAQQIDALRDNPNFQAHGNLVDAATMRVLRLKDSLAETVPSR